GRPGRARPGLSGAREGSDGARPSGRVRSGRCVRPRPAWRVRLRPDSGGGGGGGRSEGASGWGRMNAATSRGSAAVVSPIEWKAGSVTLLDQTRLPLEEVYVEVSDPSEMASAIRRLAVRGAPLLGIA